MKDPTLDSILLASTDPDRLTPWYMAALDVDRVTTVDEYRILEIGDLQLLVDRRDDIAQRNGEPGRLILNVAVADARSTVDRLNALGTAWVATLEARDGRLFATAIDPDGNYVQFIQTNGDDLGDAGRKAGTAALQETRAYTGFAVNDIDVAREFYAQTLGLTVTDEHDQLALHVGGGQPILVYPKPDHVPAAFTILNFPVDAIEPAVDSLSSRGIHFQRYGSGQDAKGIDRSGDGPPIAWFTDPFGNILSVIESDRGPTW
ncbi:MAG: VOC family protein [Acidimicrobiales bacterium]